jgi:hypothetical protein
MPVSNEQEEPSGDGEQVKRWLDYLSRLKDRSDRADQTTGQTRWVFYGVIGTLLYKAASVLPQMATDQAGRRAIEILVVLGANVATFGYFAYREFLPRIKDGSFDLSYVPHARQSFVFSWVRFFGAILAVLSMSELWLVHIDHDLPIFIRVSLFSLGCMHGLFAVGLLSFIYITGRTQKRFSSTLPLVLDSNPTVAKVLTCVVVAGLVGCVIAISSYIGFLARGYPKWLLAVQISVGILVWVWAVLSLIIRASREEMAGVITQLEREILLEGLSSEEIKERFVQRLIAPPLRLWLSEFSLKTSKQLEEISAWLTTMEGDANRLTLPPLTEDKVQGLTDLSNKLSAGMDKWSDALVSLSGQGGYLNSLSPRIVQGETKTRLDATLEQVRLSETVTQRMRAIVDKISNIGSESRQRISEGLREINQRVTSIEALTETTARLQPGAFNAQDVQNLSAKFATEFAECRERVRSISNHVMLSATLFGTKSPEGDALRNQVVELQAYMARLEVLLGKARAASSALAPALASSETSTKTPA